MTGALVAVAGGLLLDIPALLLGVLDLSTHLLGHSPAHLLLVSLTLLFSVASDNFLGDEVALLLRDIVTLLAWRLLA
jgi:hypothetical protein